MVGFLLSGSLIVCNVLAVALPADSALFRLFHAVDERPHPLVVVRVRLHEVDYIEAVFLIFLCILNSEKVPLGETVGAVVVLEVKVVLRIRNLHGLLQIGTFKATLKDERLVLILWLL